MQKNARIASTMMILHGFALTEIVKTEQILLIIATVVRSGKENGRSKDKRHFKRED